MCVKSCRQRGGGVTDEHGGSHLSSCWIPFLELHLGPTPLSCRLVPRACRRSCLLPLLTGLPLSRRSGPNQSPFQSSLSPSALTEIAPLDLLLGPSVLPRIIFSLAKSSQRLRNASCPTFDFPLYFFLRAECVILSKHKNSEHFCRMTHSLVNSIKTILVHKERMIKEAVGIGYGYNLGRLPGEEGQIIF